MNNYNTTEEFNSKLQTLRLNFEEVVENFGFSWQEISSILMLKIRKNWTVDSSNSNYQINSNDVNSFFPVLEISDSFPHWRMRMDGRVAKSVLVNFGETVSSNDDWLDGSITYRHKIQNSYPYLQLTLDGELRTLKNALRENNQIYFLKKHKEDKYYVLASKEELFSDDKFLAINPILSQSDNTLFQLSEISTGIQQQIESAIPRNKIIYGAPGTGKSYELRDQASNIGFEEDNIIRITFHPNYSYQQFVGSYKPSPIYKNFLQEGAELYGSDKATKLEDIDNKEPLIDYRFVAGPLMKQLVYALKNPDKNYLLIIEEINRASVSAVFGDVFQLLDRKSDGSSEYSITFNEEAMSFLRANGILNTEIKLPNNFFIWATMNSADQGVMPLDAAFKRRWAFEYLPLNEKESKVADSNIRFQGKDFNWNSFRKQINDRLKELGIVEDKLIGPFFMNFNELSDENSVKNKLLLYLRDDVVRHNPESLFKKRTYSDIIEMYTKGDNIFVNLEIKKEAVTEPEDSEQVS